MKKIISIIAMSLALYTGCSSNTPLFVQSNPSFISEEFTSDDTYIIVCRGYAKPGLKGLAIRESAQEGARLSAYYFVMEKFDETVKPEVDGKVLKYEMEDNSAIVYFEVHKSNLKKRIKKQQQ